MRNSILTGKPWPVILLVLIAVSMLAAMPALARSGQNPLADPWVTSTADPLEGGSSLSIVTDENNRPHISYFGNEDATDASQFGLKYARWTGSKWEIEFIESVGRTVAETSIALDSQGNPHISYFSMPSRDLKYAYFDGQDWFTEIVDGTGDVGVTNSLRLDSNELPRIAYWDETLQRVRYARFDGSQWHYSMVEDLVCGTVIPDRRVSLALDSKNRPHVSYHDCATQTALKYAVQISGVWSKEVVETGINSGLSNSIEVDSQDRPHISYRSGKNAGTLMYAYSNGSTWQFSPSIDNDFWYGNSSSLELDPGRRPRIAYTFWPPQQPGDVPIKEFRFAYLSGDQRAIEVIDKADSTSQKAQIALAIDGDGNYHVVYWDNVTNKLEYGKRGPLTQAFLLPFLLRRP